MNQIQYAGLGLGSGTKSCSSGAVTVTPSTTYILSGFIDATHVTSGSPQWAVMNVSLSTTYGTVSQTAGVKGRVQGAIAIPSAVTQVSIVALTNSCTVVSGQLLTWWAPQLEPNTSSGLATAYKPNAFDDSTGLITHAAHSSQVQNAIMANVDASGSYIAHGSVNTKQVAANALGFKHLPGDTSGDTRPRSSTVRLRRCYNRCMTLRSSMPRSPATQRTCAPTAT